MQGSRISTPGPSKLFLSRRCLRNSSAHDFNEPEILPWNGHLKLSTDLDQKHPVLYIPKSNTRKQHQILARTIAMVEHFVTMQKRKELLPTTFSQGPRTQIHLLSTPPISFGAAAR